MVAKYMLALILLKIAILTWTSMWIYLFSNIGCAALNIISCLIPTNIEYRYCLLHQILQSKMHVNISSTRFFRLIETSICLYELHFHRKTDKLFFLDHCPTLSFFNSLEQIWNFMRQVWNIMGHVGNLIGQVGNQHVPWGSQPVHEVSNRSHQVEKVQCRTVINESKQLISSSLCENAVHRGRSKFQSA